MEELISTILTPVISIIISAVISTIVGTIIKHSIEKRLDKTTKAAAELDDLRAEKERTNRRTDVENILKEELRPLNEKIDSMSEIVKFGIEGTVTLLRESMKQARDRYMLQGYVSASDDASWHELYSTYKKLGGNHFKEYVDAWKEDIENLPRKTRDNER